MDDAQSNQQSSNDVDHWNFYRVFTLFDVVFDGQLSNAQDRWNTVRANMAALADLANNQPDVYVICDVSLHDWWQRSSNSSQRAYVRSDHP